jgi:hypothetical protein
LGSTALDEGEWSDSSSSRFDFEETAPNTAQYPVDSKMCGPRAGTDGVQKRKSLPLLRIEPDRPAYTSNYTD